ncbi:MAG: ATP-binding cassette domain-containing protein [Deltaproteobacteria bacterium]
MLEFVNVSKSFWTGKQRKVILDRASFRVELGHSFGILARNGTGKTTVMQMMGGLEKPDEGYIRKTCRVSPPMGFLGGLIASHTGRENARTIARIYGIDPDYMEAFCRWCCSLEEYFEMPVSTYSSGMKSQLSLAIMLGADFDMYLIDEGMPQASDKGFAARAGSILKQRLETATLVIVSHQVATLEKFCRSAAVLHHGQLVKYDTLDEARREYDRLSN